MDGYHVLVDLLGVPTLNHDSWRFVREELWWRLTGHGAWTRQEVVYVAYFGLSLLSVVVFIAANIWLLVHALGG
jgi:hypothetical protein